jgi:16S rRNA (cytidine1402-2'-O)-methyltransferase
LPTLYVVATPIGNLEDITLRALATLRAVSLVVAEDTRSARVLLHHHGLDARLLSYNEHNKDRRIPEIIGRLAEIDIALVCDAGTPAISDPGVELVAAARAAGYVVVPIPGPSAVTAALSVAGLRSRAYRYAGFLPRAAGPLRRYLESLRDVEDAIVAFESPRRLRRTLAGIATTLPERRVAVCRDLTKLHEEVFVATAAEALAHFEAPRGEVVLVIEGGGATDATEGAADAEAVVRDEIASMRAEGLSRRQATALLARHYELPRRRLYELWLEGERSSTET